MELGSLQLCSIIFCSLGQNYELTFYKSGVLLELIKPFTYLDITKAFFERLYYEENNEFWIKCHQSPKVTGA